MACNLNLLIAVKSCHEHRLARYNRVIRETWGRDVEEPEQLIFFHGSGPRVGTLYLDEICVASRDDYDSLPQKTQAILRYFLSNTWWDYIFLCDTDTYIKPHQLLTCGFERYDVAGRFGLHPCIGSTFRHRDDRGQLIEVCHPWPSGGVGYFLSRKAAQYVVDGAYNHWAEDFTVGQITGPLIQAGTLTAADLPEFETQVAWHFSRKQHGNQVYNPKFGWMDKMYTEHKIVR